ncbi:DUF5776 domain-containing protein [Lentilactobacillus kisonensis]|nr:DUF5776 domain-containing protein [Lentilactobacillus kisonensis]
MGNQTMRDRLACTVRFIMAFTAAIVFGGLLMHATTVRAAGTGEVTYTMHAVDIYGDPIDLPFNGEKVTAPTSANVIDTSKFMQNAYENGRYTLQGYYTDNATDIGKQYYRDRSKATENFKYIDVGSFPKRNPDDYEVNVYFAYKDAESTKPDKITLTPDAINKEQDKLKLFFTDISGNELKSPIIYNFAEVPEDDMSFPITIKNYKYTAIVIRYSNNSGTVINSDTKIVAAMQANVNASDITYQEMMPLKYLVGYGQIPKQLKSGSTATYVYEKFANYLTINYVDEDGQPISGHASGKKLVPFGETYTETAPDIHGYTLTSGKTLSGKLDADGKITFTYKKAATPPNPGPTPGGGTDSTNDANNSVAPTPVKPTPEVIPPTTETGKAPAHAAKEGAAVYATDHIYMYKQATFKKTERIANYRKVKRINRPMFVVTDYARSKAGVLRYKVRDVNHKSKTAGKVGYITANRKFVVTAYYASMPKNKRITVIAKKGVNAYRQANLTKKVTHYKAGTRLKVKKLVKHNLTTRYQLTNGQFVTANKKLVIQGNY